MNRTDKINRNSLFRRIYRIGKSHVTPYCAVYVVKNRVGKNRLGITATKKIGNAVQRNRARRLITEAYRLLEDELPTGFDIVIVARTKAVYAKMQPVKENISIAFSQIRQNAKNPPEARGGANTKDSSR